VEFFTTVGEVTDRITRGAEKIAEGVVSFVKKGAMPIGILLAGIGIFILARKAKGRGGGQ
jgi:ribose 5-phosphate isomerase RpiB